jgi:hypothetical protein
MLSIDRHGDFAFKDRHYGVVLALEIGATVAFQGEVGDRDGAAGLNEFANEGATSG